jgi:hypothetical protein
MARPSGHWIPVQPGWFLLIAALGQRLPLERARSSSAGVADAARVVPRVPIEDIAAERRVDELVGDHVAASFGRKTKRRRPWSAGKLRTSRGTFSTMFHGCMSLPAWPHPARGPSWILLAPRVNSTSATRTSAGIWIRGTWAREDTGSRAGDDARTPPRAAGVMRAIECVEESALDHGHLVSNWGGSDQNSAQRMCMGPPWLKQAPFAHVRQLPQSCWLLIRALSQQRTAQIGAPGRHGSSTESGQVFCGVAGLLGFDQRSSGLRGGVRSAVFETVACACVSAC